MGTAGTVGKVDISSIWFRELRLTGSAMYATALFQGQPVRTYQMAVDLVARSDFPVAGLLTHIFHLSRYRQAFQTALDKSHYECVKVAVDLREKPDRGNQRKRKIS